MTRQGAHADDSFGEGLPVGEPAPALELPDLEGAPVSLEGLRGEETVLLFWNPGCGYCRSMHEDLLDWERHRNGGSPALVVISSGSAADTAAEGFSSIVLLDADFSTGEVFGAGGTPMAVRLDADGRVSSALAAGGEAVLELLRPCVAR
jgi:thiol-disulfide isomerase/thioredoxin